MLGGMGPQTGVSWIDDLTFASSSGQLDTLSTDDLPAPLHLIPSLAGLDVLSWSQRLEVARGLLAMLQTESTDLDQTDQTDSATGETFAAWLQQNSQHSPAVLAFWARVTVLACIAMPQNISAAQGVACVRKALLSSPDACRLGLLPGGIGPAIDHVAEDLVKQGGQVINAWPASADFQATNDGVSTLAKLVDTAGQTWATSACIVTDPSQAKQLLESAGLATPQLSTTQHTPNDLSIVHMCVQSSADTMADPANCAPLDSGPVQWLVRQPDQAVAGIEGRVTPVWAWVAISANHTANEEQIITAAREAVVRLWGSDQPLTIKSAKVLPAHTEKSPAFFSPCDPSSMPSNFMVINGAWATSAGLAGEATTKTAIDAAQKALSQASLPPADLEPSAAGGSIYQFMLG